MPFDYMNSNLNPRQQKELASRFNDSFVAEITQRAKLLRNLKYSQKMAIERISADTKWECDRTRRNEDQAGPKQTTKMSKKVYCA